MVESIRLIQLRIKKYFYSITARDHKSLTMIYILALSSIATMTLMFQLYKSTIHSEQLNAVNAIRYIDRQAHKSEKLYGKIVDTQITANSEKLISRLNEVERQIVELTASHEGMIALIEDSYECSSETCKMYFKEKPFARVYKNSLERVGPDNIVEKLEPLLESLKEYRKFLTKSGNYYEMTAKSNTQDIIYTDELFCLLLIILLIVQALFIFRPAVKSLNEALSARSDFISRISHEIRNPMNSILGMADILRSTKLSIEQIQYLSNLQRSGIVLLDMLNNLVDFSNLEKSEMTLKTSKFNVYKMIDKTTNVVSVQAHDKGLELFINIGKDVPRNLSGDVSRIEQVLINLLNNALKFTSKGYIQLSITKEEDYGDEGVGLRFSVKDTGIGIDPSKVKNIFESFVQEDSSIKRRFGGSGLGLAISKEIIELMDSYIAVNSEKGIGSEFYFVLKLGNIVEKENNNKSSIPVKNIILLSGLSDPEPLNGYINNSVENFVYCKDTTSLKSALERVQDQCKVIVDDSVGIINMINAVTLSDKYSNVKSTYALIRSNFPKENMDLIRRSGYKKFLMKPFRHWHLIGNMSDFEFLAQGEDKSQILNHNILAENVKVLAVDDANDNLFLIKEIISPLTKKIDFASNGLEAVNLMKTKKYDIVFMDIQMPIMDGYSAISKIRKTHADIPVYAVTAHAGLVEEKKCLDAGFTARITKPIDRKKIYQVFEDNFGLNTSVSVTPQEGESSEQKIIRRLLPEYFRSRKEDLEIVKRAIAEKDYLSIKKVGHRVKGSAKSYGFENVGALSAQLEIAAEDKDKEACSQLISEIEEILLTAKNSFDDQTSI